MNVSTGPHSCGLIVGPELSLLHSSGFTEKTPSLALKMYRNSTPVFPVTAQILEKPKDLPGPREPHAGFLPQMPLMPMV